MAPADDERDNVSNVTPHAQFVGNALYEYLPALSRGTGVPTPTARVELTTVSWLLDNFISYFIILIIVVFQQDIRRALGRLGQNVLPFGRRQEASHVVDERGAKGLAKCREIAEARLRELEVAEARLGGMAPSPLRRTGARCSLVVTSPGFAIVGSGENKTERHFKKKEEAVANFRHLEKETTERIAALEAELAALKARLWHRLGKKFGAL